MHEILADPDIKALLVKLGAAVVLLLGSGATFFAAKTARLRKQKEPLRRESDRRLSSIEQRLGRVEGDVGGLLALREHENRSLDLMQLQIDGLQRQLGAFGKVIARLSDLVETFSRKLDTERESEK